MKSINKKIILAVIIISAVGIFSLYPIGRNFYQTNFGWKKQAVTAVGSLPYQIGLTNVVMIKCFTTPSTPPICSGGTLCFTKDPGTCLNYYDVSGIPAGGMGSNALFSVVAVTQAGLVPGGQLIAGGMSPNFMDNGVLASAGGCYGCTP